MTRCLLTPKRMTTICGEIILGNSCELAARAAGVAPRTVRQWLEHGRRWQAGTQKPKTKTDKLYLQFLEDYQKAETALVNRHLANITTKALTAKGPWQASAWLLERRFPEYFGNKIELRGKLSVIQICGQDLTTEELSKFGILLEPLLVILREEIKDPVILERISSRIQSVYQHGSTT